MSDCHSRIKLGIAKACLCAGYKNLYDDAVCDVNELDHDNGIMSLGFINQKIELISLFFAFEIDSKSNLFTAKYKYKHGYSNFLINGEGPYVTTLLQTELKLESFKSNCSYHDHTTLNMEEAMRFKI